ncbi:hypothetical protein RJ640_015703 [Escallonia rubra]|uniref:Uncharacterized protein n=1 Tax=Escallonia rubra TaxID=112253 RepID=A0AA88R9Y0_9ASTE|nr:hypothetical protein RJ640_015703 [Escallonia rubra]
MTKEGKGKIEKFNGMNFQWWKMQVEDYLYQKDLYLPLVGEKPEATNVNEWAILDIMALATVWLSLTPQVAFNISKEKTTAAVMETLEKLCEKPFVSNKTFNMRMSKNGIVIDHLNDFNSVTNQLEFVGINFDDEIRASLFLCSLLDMNNSTLFRTLTLNDVVSFVMNDEMRRKTIGDGISSSTALSVESRGRQNNKLNNRGKKSYTRNIKIKRQVEIQRENHKPNKKKGAGGRQGDDEGSNMVTSNEHKYDNLCLSTSVDDNPKTQEPRFIVHLIRIVSVTMFMVIIDMDISVTLLEREKLQLNCLMDEPWSLKNIRHILELQKNLISVSELEREGYFVTFGENQWKVIKGSMVVARAERVRTLYTLSGTYYNHPISLASTEN